MLETQHEEDLGYSGTNDYWNVIAPGIGTAGGFVLGLIVMPSFFTPWWKDRKKDWRGKGVRDFFDSHTLLQKKE